VLALLCRAFRVSWSSSAIAGVVLALVACGYMCWFFRDPERVSPADRDLVVAAADGVVAQIRNMREDKYLKADCVRVSIFLSLFDVHVNRAPIAGTSTFLGYFPGQHNSILIEGESTRCLVKQIVGPVARRVVYWPDPDRPVPLEKGERIGMMKFGSRLDMYFPADEVTVTAKVGERVAAGVSVIARVNPRQEAP
jgi:phosphatidylserine decarboxylase